MFIGCFACMSYLCVLLGVIDLMIAGALFASAVKQAQFMPRTYAACGNALDWRNASDGRNFFTEADWYAWESYGPPETFCKFMVETWAITVSVV